MIEICVYRDDAGDVHAYTTPGSDVQDIRIVYVTEKGGYGSKNEDPKRQPGFVKFNDKYEPRCAAYQLLIPEPEAQIMDDVRVALVADRLTGHTP